MVKKMLPLVLLFVFTAGCSNQSKQDAEGDVSLRFLSAYSDSLGHDWNGVSLSRDTRRIKPVEEIAAYPSGYSVKKTYFLNFQEDQYYYYLSSRSQADSNRVLSIVPGTWYERAKTLYTSDYVDCIGAVCLIRNSKGEEKVVFDANNDEDFSNDSVLSFSEEKIEKEGRKPRITAISASVESEYFDGKTIRHIRLPVTLRKIVGKPDHYEYSIRQLQVARLIVDEKIYLMGIINHNQIEVTPKDPFWIDLNQNGRFDGEDHLENLDIPFFIGTHLFEIKSLGRFGDYLAIRDETPALTRGVEAPDFEAVTVDGRSFQLSELRGKYVLLVFWGTWCEPCKEEIITLKEAHDRFGSKGLEIVGVAIDSTEIVEKFVQEYEMDWNHIAIPNRHAIQGQYGVSDIPYPFLIDPDGVIRAYYVDLLGHRLMGTLKKTMK